MPLPPGILFHPLIPWLTPAEEDALLRRGGPAALDEWRGKHNLVVLRAEVEALDKEPEPPFWKLADAQLDTPAWLIALLGGNRAGKTRWAVKRWVATLVKHKGFYLGLSETETSSIKTLQATFYHYLPPHLKALNGKRDPARKFSINYSPQNGFSDRSLVLPNGSEVVFGIYNSEKGPGEFEGFEFGPQAADGVGVVADENLPMSWYLMLERRAPFRPRSKVVWSFTPVNGITEVMKGVVIAARTTDARPAELLAPDLIHVETLPRGHMPVVQVSSDDTARIVYFWTEFSPFGAPARDGSYQRYYDTMKAAASGGRAEHLTKRYAYGYADNVAGRACPLFGAVHIVPAGRLPARGTNYVIIDPAPDRMFVILWARVAPGEREPIYIYRVFPPGAEYGPWAIPSERALTADTVKGWDGEPGPAQTGLGWGTEDFKREIRRRGTIRPEWKADELANVDPYHRRLLVKALAGLGFKPQADGGWKIEDRSALPEIVVHEEIEEYLIDPRAAGQSHTDEVKSTNLVEKFAEGDEPMDVIPCYTGKRVTGGAGSQVGAGIELVNEALKWNPAEPFDPVMNSPRLFVAADCDQVIDCLRVYTGRGGEKGGWKDIMDVVRYLVLRRPEYYDPAAVAPAKTWGY